MSHTYEWVMAHMWTSHVTHVNESCHTCEWVVSHMWISRVTHMDGSWLPYECAMSHMCKRCVPHVAAHGGDQTSNFWISRSISFPDRSFEWWGLHLLTWKRVWNVGNSRENLFDMYGDSCENLLDILAVGIWKKVMKLPVKSDLLRLWCGASVPHVGQVSRMWVRHVN